MKQTLNTECIIIANQALTKDFYLLTVKYTGLKPKPGQFANIQVEPYLLRRPFAIFDYNESKKELKLLYKIVGDGTQMMTGWKKDVKTEVLSPLGNGFKLIDKPAVLIGGGTGIASVYLLAKKLKNKIILLGANNKEEAQVFHDLFQDVCNDIHISTMDGSYGFKGNAIEMLNKQFNKKNNYNIYACGPHAMLEAIKTSIDQKNINPSDVFVSLEARMGCGFGVCLGCAVEKKDSEDFFYVCKDGPIFNMNEINWNTKKENIVDKCCCDG